MNEVESRGGIFFRPKVCAYYNDVHCVICNCASLKFIAIRKDLKK